jgi:hypothetical protein
MIVTCDKCKTTYDDLDHLTYCPHAYFEKARSIEELCELNDLAQGLPDGTTKDQIDKFLAWQKSR